ncbi:MAG: sigma-70 family RNA polymerase sigma factor [Bryobacteraceae bacterium]
MVTEEQDRRIFETFEQEKRHLANFIRRRVPDEEEAKDILQDVFYELVEAYRLMKPVEQAGAWLFRVARNRITDLFRKKRPEPFNGNPISDGDGGMLLLEDILPSPEEGPEAAYARSILLDEIDAALEELPPEQRDVFVAHELEGRSFAEMAAETGVSTNTLLSRKRYAVLYLRRHLRAVYDEFIGR